MSIGDNIRQARKAVGMSQDELAEHIGANRVTVSRYETGEFLPSVPALQRIADALFTTPAALSGNDEDAPPLTQEARIVSAGMDNLTKEQREMILNVVSAMFPGVFKRGE